MNDMSHADGLGILACLQNHKPLHTSRATVHAMGRSLLQLLAIKNLNSEFDCPTKEQSQLCDAALHVKLGQKIRHL